MGRKFPGEGTGWGGQGKKKKKGCANTGGFLTCSTVLVVFQALTFGDQDREGSNLRKLEGGGNLNFPRPLKFTPVYRDSIENRQFAGQKSKTSRGDFRAYSPPPLAFGMF